MAQVAARGDDPRVTERVGPPCHAHRERRTREHDAPGSATLGWGVLTTLPRKREGRMSTQELPPIEPVPEGHAPPRDPVTGGIMAAGLGMRAAGGWVYRHVDIEATAGEVVELAGSGGTGRSMLLLTLAGRARPTTGTLRVCGVDRPARIRPWVALARVHDAIGPEPEQTVGQALVERARWDRVHPAGSDGLGYRRDEVRELTGLAVPDRERIAALARVEQTLLAVALALLARPRVVLLDDLDVGLSATEQHRVWSVLHAAAQAEQAVAVASTSGAVPAQHPRQIVDLHPSHVEES